MSASSERERMPQRQLGELMTELGLISEEQLATVLEVQQQSKRPLGQIIVELGFASGAAVAHALAMQSGGALRTEYGFALGLHPEHAENDADESAGGLPKLRLAPTAVAPPVGDDVAPVEDPAIDDDPEEEAVEPVEETSEVEVEEETEAVDKVTEVEEIADAEAKEIAPEVEEIPDPEPEPEDVFEDPEASVDTPPP